MNGCRRLHLAGVNAEPLDIVGAADFCNPEGIFVCDACNVSGMPHVRPGFEI